MNREETKRCVAVMQAYVDGEEIEEKELGGWSPEPTPEWDWFRCSYRIKLQPKLRPWTAAEVVARMAERPLLVKRKNDPDSKVMSIVAVEPGGFMRIADRDGLGLVSLPPLADNYEQHDGSPCGVVE